MNYDYPKELLEAISDGSMKMQHEIVMIPTELIWPHPDNPRKDLGDLEELADSIMAQGVLQNLTVVPWGSVYEDPAPADGAVVTVIGHRRCAAAKKAGVRELPCIIVDMDKHEQVATMLLENMQRSDLTIPEQAQGFQLMMDLGSSVEEISDLTGFAPRTVQRRLQIAKLPEEAFAKDVLGALRLEDYVELAKIKDPKMQAKAIKYAGTSSFEWTVKSILRDQQVQDDMKKVIPMLEAAGYEKYSGKDNPAYSSKYDVRRQAKVSEIVKAGSLPVTKRLIKNGIWYLYIDTLYLITEAEKKIKKNQKKLDADRKRRELAKVCRTAYESRYEWIKAYKPKKEHEKIINRAYLEMSLREISQSRTAVDYYKLFDVTDRKESSKWYKPYDHELIKAVDEDGALAFVTWVLTGDGADVKPYYEGFMENPPAWKEETDGRDIWLRAYGFLEQIGYPVSDEERALLDGTHELYGEKEQTDA